MQEKLLFIDVSTTWNDFAATGHECPIQFSAIFVNSTGNKSDFFHPAKSITFNIMPDEEIFPMGYCQVGQYWPDNFKSLDIKTGLKKIKTMIDMFLAQDYKIAGFNLHYDLDILNKNIARIFDGNELGKIEIPEEKTIDVMKLAMKTIPSEKVGTYRLEHLMIGLFGTKTYFGLLDKYKTNRGSWLDNMFASVVLWKIMENGNIVSVEELVENCKKPKLLEKFPFGKYKGIDIKTLVLENENYINWVLSTPDIVKKYPDLIHTIGKLTNQEKTPVEIQPVAMDDVPGLE